MKFFDILDRIVRPFAIPNLTLVLIAGHALMFFAVMGNPAILERAVLVWDLVLQGEVWRLLTFLIVPADFSPIFLFFMLYIFYMFGTALEQYWGIVRYNAFLMVGALLTIFAAAFVPGSVATGAFLYGTVFLAFATYNPDFTLNLFFILPVKVKWLAWIQAAGYGLTFIGGDLAAKVLVAASIGNYLIFFAPTVFGWLRNRQRRQQWEARQFKAGSQARHTCAVCGIDSNTHPNADFRYCSKCNGEKAYCEDHLRNHEHVG